ncbi:hypothetical protein B0H16DRAFT_1736003 [Mycena metata]|uniref:Uncharacterized protein n=1 Tax=Mycena metata TaxID=1033252 RepID=A0AAD7MNG5_9AGAR|nr:hypothetical protein B0H16DRAFT_1736003 [Mycena metata]
MAGLTRQRARIYTSFWRAQRRIIRIEQSLRAAAPLVLQFISSVLASAVSGQDNSQDPNALLAALACLVAWLPHKLLPQEAVALLVPPTHAGSAKYRARKSIRGGEHRPF